MNKKLVTDKNLVAVACVVLAIGLPLYIVRDSLPDLGLFVSDAGNACYVAEKNLGRSKNRFKQDCAGLKRKDCDRVDGKWVCSNHNIPNGFRLSDMTDAGSSRGSGNSTVASTVSSDGECAVVSNELSAAHRAFEEKCSGMKRKDCDPGGSGWICSNKDISRDSLAIAQGGGSSGRGSAGAGCIDTDGDGWGWDESLNGGDGGSCPMDGGDNEERSNNDGGGENGGGDNDSRNVSNVGDGDNGNVSSGEDNGGTVITIEAESFSSKDSRWRIMNVHGGGSGSYLELLPDTRVTHSDPLNKTNFWNTAGTGPLITYNVDFPAAGRYRVEARAYSTGSEDNGIHVGINGSWPASGARMQWCSGKNRWTWSGAQRTNSNHCGVPNGISIDVPSAGNHRVMFSAREDGFEMDQFRLIGVGGGNAGSGNNSGNGNDSGGNVAVGNNAASGPFSQSRGDLVALHYDHAPDKDDGHATVAGKIVTQHFGVNPIVVGGTVGTNRDRYVSSSERVMDVTWGNNWLNAYRSWNSSVDSSVNRWLEVLNKGGHIWIAEGGQSDFTADVVRAIKGRSNVNTQQRIHLVQHSAWNERHTTGSDLSYVRSNTDYIKINDGNNPNGTADLNFERNYQSFVEKARSGRWSREWNAAFDYLPPSEKLDFSDTVELLHILGVGKGQVSDVDEFGDYFSVGSGTSQRSSATNNSSENSDQGNGGGNNSGGDDTSGDGLRNIGGSTKDNPRSNWKDSYSANGQCYCDSNGYDHGVRDMYVGTNQGRKSIPEICARIGQGPGSAGNPVYNDIQCGNGPANNAGDEDRHRCPGRVDQGSAGCRVIGPTWNLDRYYP